MPEGGLGRLVGHLRGGVETQRENVTESCPKMVDKWRQVGPKGSNCAEEVRFFEHILSFQGL